MSEVLSGNDQGGVSEFETSPESSLYGNSLASRKLESRERAGLPKVLFFTDFDHTLYESGEIEATNQVGKILEQNNIPCVVVTARSYKESDFRELFSQITLRPDIIIGSNGTEISVLGKDGDYHNDETYTHEMSKNWSWKEVANAANDILGKVNRKSTLLSQEREVKPFHVAINIDGQPDDDPQMLQQLASVPGANFVYWGDQKDHFTVAYVPKAGGKKPAIEYVADHLGVGDSIVAGDSTNDITMMEISDEDRPKHSSILVGGSKPALVRVFSRQVDADFSEPVLTNIFRDKKTGREVKISSEETEKGPKALKNFLQDRRTQNIISGRPFHPDKQGFHNPWE